MRRRRLSLLFVLPALLAIPAFAGPGERLFELNGRIVQPDGRGFGKRAPVVFLFGSTTPFATRTLADASGKFKFKRLAAGTYTLAVSVPLRGELSRTVEVGVSFADAKGRIAVEIKFDQSALTTPRQLGVSATALSVPDSARSQYLKALQCLENKDVEGGVKHLQNAVEIAPQFAAAWNYLGTIFFQRARYDEAENYFREALKHDPDAYDPLVNLGGTLLAFRRYEESLSYNELAVLMRPNDPLAHSQLGQSCYHLGQIETAEAHLKRAKALDASHFTLPQILLAQIYRLKGNLAGAVRELEEFLRLHPDSSLAQTVRKELDDTRARMP